MRVRRDLQSARETAARLAHHARTLPATLAHRVAGTRRALDLPRQFWGFVLAAALYNTGLFLFYLLYNLYLLDRGYRENVLGQMAGAFTIGNLA
jgi:hypothetical protein